MSHITLVVGVEVGYIKVRNFLIKDDFTHEKKY